MLKLFAYEMKEHVKYYLGLAVLLVIFSIFLAVNISQWLPGMSLLVLCAGGWLIPLGIFVIIGIYNSWCELCGNTGYTLYTLPLNGVSILSARLLVSLVDFIAVTGMAVVSVLIHISLIPQSAVVIPREFTALVDESPVYLYCIALTVILFPAMTYFANLILNTTFCFGKSLNRMFRGNVVTGMMMSLIIIFLLINIAGRVAVIAGNSAPLGIPMEFQFIGGLHPGLNGLAPDMVLNYAETAVYVAFFAGAFAAAAKMIDGRVNL